MNIIHCIQIIFKAVAKDIEKAFLRYEDYWKQITYEKYFMGAVEGNLESKMHLRL